MSDREKVFNIVYQPLPIDVYGAPPMDPGKELLTIVKSDVGAAIFERAKESIVVRMPTKIRKTLKKKKQQHKNRHMTNKALKVNNLNRLPKRGWNYASLQEMRNMWAAYMHQCLSTNEKPAPDVADSSYLQFHSTLGKVELVGANIKVVQSKTPSNVGVEGTIVLETQQTFQIVTPQNKLKILLKAASIFVFVLNGIEFKIFGQTLLTRPHERVVKKFKSFIKMSL